jgi:glycosyltransferase involved in cell wall biosynthesis
MKNPALAFVVERYGDDVAGLPDSFCAHLAQMLAPYASIEVLTTCARDSRTGTNFYPAGHTNAGGVHVHRFALDAKPAFKHTESRQPNSCSASESEQEAMLARGPLSSALQNYIELHARRFDHFAFFGYRCASTYLALPLVREKAVLWPFAQDERSLELSMWPHFFQTPKQIVFSTMEEQRLFARRFGSAVVAGELVPIGNLAPTTIDANRFRDRFEIGAPFALYVGEAEHQTRRDVLFEYVSRYQSEAAMYRKLVVLGNDASQSSPHLGILMLGSDDDTRWGAIGAADFVIVPTDSEGALSLLSEAWSAGKPVLLDAGSRVLVEECRRAGAGLWYSSYDEFAAALDILTPGLARRLGEQGRRYANRNYIEGEAVTAYRRILEC